MEPSSLLFGMFFLFWLQAFVRGGWDKEKTRYSHRRDLRLTSLTLVVLAALSVVTDWGTSLSGYAWWILFGMAITHVGDLITGELIRVRHPYLVATGIFGLGHLFYLGAVVVGAKHAGVSIPLWAPGAGLLLGALVWGTLLRSSHRRSLVYPALGYAMLLGGIMGAGVGLTSVAPGVWRLGVGLVFFTLSDLLLGLRELRSLKFFLIYDVVWFFYITGQFFIVWSALAGF